MKEKDIICKDCKLPVTEMTEYTEMALMEDMEVNAWVAANDNLYDRATHTVICTKCYVKGIMEGRYK